MFGICLHSTALGADPVWPSNGSCPASDVAEWRAISSTMSEAAETTLATTLATATFNFGVRAANNQPPGVYNAPISFDVISANT